MPSSPFSKGKKKVTSTCPGSGCPEVSGSGGSHLSEQTSHRTALSWRNRLHTCISGHLHHAYSGPLRWEREGAERESRSPGHPLWGEHSSQPTHCCHPRHPGSQPGHVNPFPSKLSALRPSAQIPDTTSCSISDLAWAGFGEGWQCGLHECSKPHAPHIIGSSISSLPSSQPPPILHCLQRTSQNPEYQTSAWPKKLPEAQRSWVTCLKPHGNWWQSPP